MKVELQGTVKGSQLWSKGTVFDNAKEPFPSDIQHFVSSGNPLVRVLPEPVISKPIPKPIEILEEPALPEEIPVQGQEDAPVVEETISEEKVEEAVPEKTPFLKKDKPAPKVKPVLMKKKVLTKKG